MVVILPQGANPAQSYELSGLIIAIIYQLSQILHCRTLSKGRENDGTEKVFHCYRPYFRLLDDYLAGDVRSLQNRGEVYTMIKLFNMDCMVAMKDMPDKAFELAIVDPPYGIGDCVSSKSMHIHKTMTWNDSIPPQEYFDELQRVSKNQIIWGANYYQGIRLPAGRIIHDKLNGDCQSSSLSDADIASQSFNKLIKIYPYRWRGNVQGSSINWKNSGIDRKIHPTQKPVALYQWLLKNYAKPGDKILDTHGGSMSIAIACHDLGFDLDLYEIDKDYFNAGKERLERHMKQQNLFQEPQKLMVNQI